ncbi:toxin-antitoxin system HicB family antitoxin [Gemmatimonadota bacterium]
MLQASAGKDYSGKFVVRVGKELHKTLVVKALREGVSLNSYCVHLLREPGSRYREKKTNAGEEHQEC